MLSILFYIISVWELYDALENIEDEEYDVLENDEDEEFYFEEQVEEKQEIEQNVEEEQVEEEQETEQNVEEEQIQEIENNRIILTQQIAECDEKYKDIVEKIKKIELQKNDINKKKNELISQIEENLNNNVTSSVVTLIIEMTKKLDEFNELLKELDRLEIECKENEKANREEKEKYKNDFLEIIRGG